MQSSAGQQISNWLVDCAAYQYETPQTQFDSFAFSIIYLHDEARKAAAAASSVDETPAVKQWPHPQHSRNSWAS